MNTPTPHITEAGLRELARTLQTYYRALDEVKHIGKPTPQVRVMKPTPGPKPPGNFNAISTYVEQEDRLREVAQDALTTVGADLRSCDFHAKRLCVLLAYYAQPLSELDWVDDLACELRHQVKIIGDCLGFDDRVKVDRGEVWLSAVGVARVCSGVSADTVRKWGERGFIDRRRIGDRRWGYRLEQVQLRAQREVLAGR